MESATVTLTMAPDGTDEEIDLQSGVRDALQQMNITTSGEWLYVCQVLSIEKSHMKWSSKLAEMHEHCVSHSVVSNAICSCTAGNATTSYFIAQQHLSVLSYLQLPVNLSL